MKTIVYVDGCNLYYGLLRKSPYKWLDLFSLFQHEVLDKTTEVIEIRYYTARILSRIRTDPESSRRQCIYLDALLKMPPNRIKIIEGKMELSRQHMRLVKPLPDYPPGVQVYRLSEKKTDVNLASDLISGAFLGRCECAVICSNDSDFAPAMAAVRQHCPGVQLGLVVPIPGTDHRRAGRDLVRQAHWFKLLSPVHLSRAQLPTKIPHTSLYQPHHWRIR